MDRFDKIKEEVFKYLKMNIFNKSREWYESESLRIAVLRCKKFNIPTPKHLNIQLNLI